MALLEKRQGFDANRIIKRNYIIDLFIIAVFSGAEVDQKNRRDFPLFPSLAVRLFWARVDLEESYFLSGN